MRPRTSPQPHPQPGTVEPAAPTETTDRSAVSAASAAPPSSASTSSGTAHRPWMETALYLSAVHGWSTRETAHNLVLHYPVVRRVLRQHALRRCSRDGDGARPAAAEVRR